ncbi:MAG: prepilin-type N-terminal cleavage/methylation domain-containing protein [Fimbriimonadales bacterium]
MRRSGFTLIELLVVM